MTLSTTVYNLIDLALAEDLAQGDITSDTLFEPERYAVANVTTRQSAVISGIPVAQEVFQRVDSRIIANPLVDDGDKVPPKTTLMVVEGPLVSILKAERVALNFLQHLCGVATLTFQFVGTVTGTGTQVLHTRKTIPGLRELEIKAVVDGGGVPHRRSLGDAVLIKDNHIKACGSIAEAVQKIRRTLEGGVRIEVECDTLDQVQEALEAGADMLLLDNMDIATLTSAVAMAKGKAVTEASGGVTLRNAMTIAKTGVDYISTSQITLSTVAVDIGLDFQ